MLGDVEETIYTIEEDEDGEESVKVWNVMRFFYAGADATQTTKKQSEMLFVRGEMFCYVYKHRANKA